MCLQIKSVSLIQKTLNIKKLKILKCVRNLCKKLKGLKSTKPITYNLDSKINLLLIRDTMTQDSTMGKLFLNGEEFCNTLELPWKENQKNISCIPSGNYDARLRLPRESATRDYIHLLVKDVPNRSYVLIHIGNTTVDTQGCILVGQTRKQHFVGNSRLAMDLLIKEILNLGGENIKLIIKNK